MAAADYRRCDVCNGKVFCDAHLNYDETQEENDPEAFRIAGHVEPWGARLDYLGDWAVICSHCAKTHKTIVVPLYAAPAASQAEPQREPLSDDDINKLAWKQNLWTDGMIEFSFLAFAREVERAHGIGGSDEC